MSVSCLRPISPEDIMDIESPKYLENARVELIDYLNRGEVIPGFVADRPHVSRYHLIEMLVNAGYMDVAYGTWNGIYHFTDTAYPAAAGVMELYYATQTEIQAKVDPKKGYEWHDIAYLRKFVKTTAPNTDDVSKASRRRILNEIMEASRLRAELTELDPRFRMAGGCAIYPTGPTHFHVIMCSLRGAAWCGINQLQDLKDELTPVA